MNELARFILDAFRQAGGIVEPPAYGIYEALLPEEVARRWAVPAYQRLAFADVSPPEAVDPEGFTVVGYGHPLVETLLEEVHAEPACAAVYVNDLRLDRRGLLDLARQTLAFPNARLVGVSGEIESAALCHLVRFNFKAALITDEKRERLVSVVMDTQAGFAIPELAHSEQLARLTEEPPYKHLADAPVRWLLNHRALSLPVLEGLLERAKQAALADLDAPLRTLHSRAARYLELDLARLTEYYDEIARGLQQRIERASTDSRRTSLESKLAATQADRQDKLADAEAKYRLRVELELINLQVIGQPKILLPVCIEHRSVRAVRTVVWDPLLHRIEPLACDVCGQPATRLTLCSSGHLAHEGCLSSQQCVDCKRVYCRLCSDQISECAVCHRPVCQHSLNRCSACQRDTCREHVSMCHAADGEPAQLPLLETPDPSPQPPSVREATEKPTTTPAPSQGRKPKRKGRRPATQQSRRTTGSAPRPANYRIEVYVELEVPQVNAFVMTRERAQIAVRSWTRTDDGIAVECRCEKRYRCPADARVLEVTEETNIEALHEAEIEELRREYGVSARRLTRYAVVSGEWRQVPRIALRDEWRE